MNITITIQNRIATLTSGGELPCGADGCTVTFTFDSEWSASTVRTARFSYLQKDGWHYRDVSFTGTVAAVPALPEVDCVFVGVYTGDIQTAAPARVACCTADEDSTPAVDSDGYYMPYVQADGDLMWSPTRDDMPAVPTVNIQGPRGEQGAQGAQGARGPQGEKGEKGEKGDTGAAGAAGADGSNGSAIYMLTVEVAYEGTLPVDEIVISRPDGAVVHIGDYLLSPSGYLYRVITERTATTSINAAWTGLTLKGQKGADGYTPVRGVDYWTADDQTAVVAATAAALPTETWTFELADGTTVQKAVVTA